jgi:hypothetical protein
MGVFVDSDRELAKARILRPGLQAPDPRFTSQAPPPLRSAYTALDRAIQQLTSEAKLAA